MCEAVVQQGVVVVGEKGLNTHNSLFLPTMKVTHVDERGRIALGLKMVDKHGDKFAVISHGKEIVLVPIPKDPLAELRRLAKGSGIDRFTIKELRKMALQDAEKEAMKSVRGHRLSSRSG